MIVRDTFLRREAPLTGIISYLNGATAPITLAKAKDAKCDAIERTELYRLDDWRREDGQQEQGEGREEGNR